MILAVAAALASFEVGQAAHARVLWSAQRPETATGPQPGATQGHAEKAVPRLRISASRQPLSVLRAFAGERVPEGAALYSIRACSIGTEALAIDTGQIEQALEQSGVALSTRPLAQLAVRRGRSRGLSALARFAEAASFAAPVIVGFAAGGTFPLRPWQVAAVSSVGQGIRIIGDATRPEREMAAAAIGEAGPWLADMPTIALGSGECSPRMLALGSYRRDSPPTLIMER